jgi:hypothetical protein
MADEVGPSVLVPVKSNDNVTESGWFYQMIMLPECQLL